MKRPQYVFRPNLNDPQHRRAWELLQQMPSARRKEFLVQSMLYFLFGLSCFLRQQTLHFWHYWC